MTVGVVNQPAKRAGRHHGVVVEKKEVTAVSVVGSLVVGPRVTAVAVVADQIDLGKLAGHHGGRTVGGGIIDDDDLNADALLIPQRFQATSKQIATVPIGNADRHVE